MRFEVLPIAEQTDNSVLLTSVQIPADEAAHVCTKLEKIDLNEFITGGSDPVYLSRVVGDLKFSGALPTLCKI